MLSIIKRYQFSFIILAMICFKILPFIGYILLFIAIFPLRRAMYQLGVMITTGVVICLPKVISQLLGLFKISTPVFLSEIVINPSYTKWFEYGQKLIKVGIVFIIIVVVLQWFQEKTESKVSELFRKEEQKRYEIQKENDYRIKEKTQDMKNTSVVICPNCGATNTLKYGIGVCQYCRSQIQGERREDQD